MGLCNLEEIGGINGRSLAASLEREGQEGGREVRNAPMLRREHERQEKEGRILASLASRLAH